MPTVTPVGQPGRPRLAGEHDAGHEARRGRRCRGGCCSVWPVVPSSTSWLAITPRRRTACTGMPPAPLPPRAPAATSSSVGSGAHRSLAAAMRATVAIAVPDGASRLRVVVELEHLGGLEERRRQLGEAHRQHGADGEVGGDEAVARRERRLERGEVGVVEAGRARRRRGCRARPATAACVRAASATVKSTTTVARRRRRARRGRRRCRRPPDASRAGVLRVDGGARGAGRCRRTPPRRRSGPCARRRRRRRRRTASAHADGGGGGAGGDGRRCRVGGVRRRRRRRGGGAAARRRSRRRPAAAAARRPRPAASAASASARSWRRARRARPRGPGARRRSARCWRRRSPSSRPVRPA